MKAIRLFGCAAAVAAIKCLAPHTVESLAAILAGTVLGSLIGQLAERMSE